MAPKDLRSRDTFSTWTYLNLRREYTFWLLLKHNDNDSELHFIRGLKTEHMLEILHTPTFLAVRINIKKLIIPSAVMNFDF